MKKIFVILVLSLVGFQSCSDSISERVLQLLKNILNNSESFYFIDFANYPQKDRKLPIGIFDSGTGGLTVLDAIVNSDEFNNSTHKMEQHGDNKN